MIFRPPLRIIFVVTFYSREDVLYKSGKDGMKMFYLYFDKKIFDKCLHRMDDNN